MSIPAKTNVLENSPGWDLGSPGRKMSENQWNMTIGKEHFRRNNQRSGATVYSSSQKVIPNDQQMFNFELRQPQTNQNTNSNINFGSLRKKIQTNEPNFISGSMKIIRDQFVP